MSTKKPLTIKIPPDFELHITPDGLSRLDGERNLSCFASLPFDSGQKIVYINIAVRNIDHFINSATRIHKKLNQRPKSQLGKRPWLKRKN